MDDDSRRQQSQSRSKTKKPRTVRSKSDPKTSFVQDLKTEWSLFWAGFKADDETLPLDKPEELSLDQLKTLKKSLSDERKKLNQKLESIRKEIDVNTAKVDSLKIVGGKTEEILLRIADLNDQGQKVSEQLARMDHRLKLARAQENHLRSELFA